jgi:modification methylase
MTATADQLLDFGSDLSLRRRYFSASSFAHPAKLHLGLLVWIVERYTAPGETIIDPMAGIGSTAYAALLQRNVVLREIEPRWLALCHENASRIVRAAGMFAGSIEAGRADAREPWGYTADHIVFSPPYGCEASPNRFRAQGILSHKQRFLAEQPGKLAQRWRLLLERERTQPGSVGSIQFHYGSHPAQIGHLRGDRYWREMAQVYTQARAGLRPGGRMILVIKDHIKDGQRVRVADETVACCEQLGFALTARHQRRVWPLSLWQRRRKERGEPIVEEEDVLVFEQGAL